MHEGWEKVDEKVADKGTNQTHQCWKGYFGTQYAEHCCNQHEYYCENSEVFVGNLSENELQYSCPSNRDIWRKSADHIDEITDFDNQNSPFTEIAINKSIFAFFSGYS